MKRIDECLDENSGFGLVFSKKEESTTFCLKHSEEFHCDIIKIDDCVFSGIEFRRCDFLFLVNGRNEQNKKFKKSRAIYVELKGKDIRSACEQLYNAIDRTKTQIPQFEIKAKVIGTKSFHPDIRTNSFYRKVKKLIRNEIEFHRVGKGNNYTHTEII